METIRLIEKLEIKVLEMCYGCQTIKITFDSETFEFMASYLGDCPLSSLIRLVAEIDSDIEYGNVPDKLFIEWLDEPGAAQFDVEYDGTVDTFTIKTTDDDLFISDKKIENPIEEYHFQVEHKVLKGAVIKEATRMLKKYGIRGYNGNWAHGLEEFPVSSFLRLLGNKSTFDNESETYASCLEKEIRLLNSIL